MTGQSGSVGQWAIRMGRRIVDTYKVPVALVNGAHGGQPISFFQRNDANPDDLDHQLRTAAARGCRPLV